MTANVVEILVKATDGTAAGFAKTKASAEDTAGSLDELAAAEERVTEAGGGLAAAYDRQAAAATKQVEAQRALRDALSDQDATLGEVARATEDDAVASERLAEANTQLAAAVDQNAAAQAKLTTAQQAAAGAAGAEAGAQDEAATAVTASVSQKAAAQAKLTAQSRAYDAAVKEQIAAQRELIAVNEQVAAGATVSADEQAAALGKVEKADTAVAARAKEMAATQEEASFSAGSALQKFGMIGSMALAGIGYESIKMAMSFQQATERLVTQAGVPQKELGSLRSGILGLAGAVGFSPDSLAESLYHVASNMASLGATAPQMLGAVKIAAEGAKVGGANLEDVTNALTAAIASGIPGVQNYSQAMGALNAIVGAGDMKMQDLSEAMGSGLMAVVKGYGLSLKDVGAALDVFGDNNIRGAHAATDLRMAVQALAVPAAAGKAQLASMGLSMQSLGDTMRQHGLLAALQELQARFKAAGVTAQEQGGVITEIFGKKAGVGLAVLMDQMDRLKSKYPDITAGANNFGQAWAATQQTTKQRLDELRATFDALGTSIGMKLLPAISSFAGFLDKNRAVLQALAPIILAIVAAMSAWAGVMKVIEILSDLSPWTIAIMAVIAVVVLLVEHWKAVEAVTREVFGAVKNIVMDAVDFIREHWKLLLTAFLAIAMGPFGLVVGLFIDNFAKIKHAVLDVVDWIGAHWKLLLAIFGGPLGLIIDAVVTHWSAIEHVFQAGWRFVESVTRAFWDGFLRPYIMFQVHAIEAILGWFSHLGALLGGWWNDAANAVRTGIDKLIGFVESIPGRINSALGGLPGMMFRAGVHVIESLLSGITSMIGQVGSTIGHIASKIAGFFGLSPAIEGPLSGGGAPEIRGQHFAADLARGMASGQAPIAAAAQRLAGAAAIGPAGGGGYAGTGAGAGAPLVIQFTGGGGSGLEQQFWVWFKAGLRAQGGDPRLVNKKVAFL